MEINLKNVVIHPMNSVSSIFFFSLEVPRDNVLLFLAFDTCSRFRETIRMRDSPSHDVSFVVQSFQLIHKAQMAKGNISCSSNLAIDASGLQRKRFHKAGYNTMIKRF